MRIDVISAKNVFLFLLLLKFIFTYIADHCCKAYASGRSITIADITAEVSSSSSIYSSSSSSSSSSSAFSCLH
jgi:hypothetical protein